MKKWYVLIALAVAQFVMVLDSTVMNVSISEVVADLHTTVSGLQTAITMYTLTMAAFMLTGGKLGDKWGRLTAFKIGAVVYGVGSLMTALAPNLTVLLIGWSVIEGLGAVLVIPAIAALIASSYSGKDRALAFAAIGGVAGAAAAAGPLIGGFVTTYLSWRYVFAAETVVMVGLLVSLRYLSLKNDKQPAPIDSRSVLLSALGMGVLVYGMLQSKTWGWVKPMGAMTINGHSVTPFGISMSAYLIAIGGVLLWWFYARQRKLEDSGGHPLFKVSLLEKPVLRAGLGVLMSQYMITAAVFFIIPIYLQMVLGYDALKTGIKILPLSFAVMLFAVLGPRFASKLAPRTVVRIGQLTLVVGALFMLASINETLRGFLFGSSMFVLGAGIGLLASQLGNINLSAATEKDSSEVGGLQGTFQNLGSSFGTALIGSVVIASLSAGFVSSVNANAAIPQQVQTYIQEHATTGVPVVPASEVTNAALSAGLSSSEANELSQSYLNAQIQGLEEGAFFVAILALATVPLSRKLPTKTIGKT